ncbi:hypothetical protein BT69DRAFT_1278403 [Atractiella rhizophila]|nr:hypothetical protein BT69DRAFT_1278403 [Atractiella rhizophila]
MSKPPEILTFDLTVERPHLSSVLRLMLHTILFHRTPGSVAPTSLQAYDLTFPAVESVEINELVESKVQEAEREVKRNKAQIVLLFHEKRPPTSAPKSRPQSAVSGITNWFSSRPLAVQPTPNPTSPDLPAPWEAYVINLTLPSFTPSVSRANAERLLRRQLSGFVLKVIEWTAAGRETPAITSQEVAPWPIRILINPLYGSLGFSIPETSTSRKPSVFPPTVGYRERGTTMPLLKDQLSEPV